MFKRSQPQRRGAAAIEFAIVAVPMIIVVFGCLEVSRLFMIDSMAENAVFESLRHVMVSGSTKAEGVAKANEMLALFGTRDANVVVTPFEGGVAQPEITDATDEVSVSISIPMSSSAGGIVP